MIQTIIFVFLARSQNCCWIPGKLPTHPLHSSCHQRTHAESTRLMIANLLFSKQCLHGRGIGVGAKERKKRNELCITWRGGAPLRNKTFYPFFPFLSLFFYSPEYLFHRTSVKEVEADLPFMIFSFVNSIAASF